MNALIKFLKSILIKIKKVILVVLMHLNISIPFYILVFFALQYFIISISNEFSNDQYKILFAIIGITATFSGLSFRASSSSEDSIKKKTFYNQAQRLFHSTILFSMAISLIYIRNEFDKLTLSYFQTISKYFDVISFVKIICLFLGQSFFIFGLVYLWIALEILNKMLYEKKLLP